MQIVELNKEYLLSALRLQKRSFKGLSEDDKLSFKAALEPEKYRKWYQRNEIVSLEYWVGVEDDKAIGTSGLYQECDEKYWIGWFCVDKNYRGLGFGSKLLEFTIDKAKDRGIKNLYVYTDHHSTEAISLYKKFGFVETDYLTDEINFMLSL